MTYISLAGVPNMKINFNMPKEYEEKTILEMVGEYNELRDEGLSMKGLPISIENQYPEASLKDNKIYLSEKELTKKDLWILISHIKGDIETGKMFLHIKDNFGELFAP